MGTKALQFFDAKHILKQTPQLGELPGNREIFQKTFQVAWPSMLESFMMAIVGMVDTIMVSSLGPSAIAAIGLTNQPKFICLAVFTSMSIAVSALVARRRGEGDWEGANKVLTQSLMIVLILDFFITLVALSFADPILRFTGTNADTHELAVQYYQIVVGGQLFAAVNIIINAAQRGAGNTKIAMWTNLVSNGVNVVFNYLLIQGRMGFPALGVRGAAIATVLGTLAAMLMALRSVSNPRGYLYLWRGRKYMRFDRKTLHSLVDIGSSSLADQVFLRIGFMLYIMIVAHLGTNAFAAYQIGMNILTMSFAMGDGLSVAAIALVGQSLGQNRQDLAKIYGGFCQRVGLVCSLVLAVVYFLLSDTIFQLFSDEQEILEFGPTIMFFIVIIVMFQIAQVIYSGCLKGGGDTRFVALVSLLSVSIMRPLAGWLFVYPLDMGLVGAWIGLTMDQGLRMLLTFIRFKSDKWLKIKI